MHLFRNISPPSRPANALGEFQSSANSIGSPLKSAFLLIRTLLEFGTWVHVSFSRTHPPRHSILEKLHGQPYEPVTEPIQGRGHWPASAFVVSVLGGWAN
jgi:hypothetical protein